MTGDADLQVIEDRIWSLLEPFRSELEPATIYGMPFLRWPGSKAHDYFAAVRAAKSYVSLYLLVADKYPDALAATPEALLKRRTGKAAFSFPRLDDEMAADLAALLERLYARYRAGLNRGPLGSYDAAMLTTYERVDFAARGSSR